MWNGWAIAFNVAALYLVHFTDMSNVVWVPIGISGGLKNLISSCKSLNFSRNDAIMGKRVL